MKKHLMAVIVFGLLGGLILAGTTWSQSPARNATSAVQPVLNVFQTEDTESPRTLIGTQAVTHPHSEIGQLMNQLREADDDAKKAELTKQLETAVAKHFDEDLKNRETELTKLEERLTKLRTQLDRRRKAKAEIIQLQIKVMVNEAEGLGFSGSPGMSWFSSYFPAMGGRGGTVGGMPSMVGPRPTRPQPKR